MNDLIVDGSSLFARCWYAKIREKSKDKDDKDKKPEPPREPTEEELRDVLDLCVQTVLQFLDQRNGRLRMPIHRTLFAWEGRAKTDKHRKEKPGKYDELRRYFKGLLVDFFGTVNAHHEDYEADDVVATVAFNSKAKNVIVVSGDKDLMQLQGGNVLYYCLYTKAMINSRLICQKFGVKRPSQVAIAQAVIGDRSDGIPGVPNWGPKKVIKLFEAVTDKMNFNQALEMVQAQIPFHLMGDFLESLDKTLLHTEIEGMPEPADLKFCETEDVEDEGFYGLARSFDQVALQYDNREDALAAMLRDSRAVGRHRTDD